MINNLNKKVIVLLLICSVCCMFVMKNGNIYARRYDKENFPVSKISDIFPDSYNEYIDVLKEKHPNWIFKAVYTGLDFNEVVKHESYEVSEGISLVPDSYGSEWKKDGVDYYMDGNFVVASKEAVMYMLDPRNHLSEKEIFQFETLNYSEKAHTKDSVEKVLYGTSMYQRNEYKNAGNMVTMEKTYSDIILENAIKYNVSATHIASRIKQETAGDIINNGSINGSVEGYEGLYNFFNIGASANSNGTGAVVNGLSYAKVQGWTTPEFSIDGGVNMLANKWIKWGQNTTYFQKWDVNNEGNAIALYTYQYMQNIIAPTSESIMTQKAYSKAGLLEETYEFRIPVYENMPEYACPYPVTPSSESEYESDSTIVKVDSASGLNLRTGPSTNYDYIMVIPDKTEMIRIQKSINTQWDRVRLDSGIEGYVFREGIIEIGKYIPVDNVSLNKQSLTLIEGKNEVLVATVSPDNATKKDVKWKSSDTSVVTVDESGNVIAKSKGTAQIIVTTLDSNKKASCEVIVESAVESITLPSDNYTIEVGKELEIKPDIKNAESKNYTVSIEDENIVTYKDGKITAKQAGSTKVTFTTESKKASVSCVITVDKKVEDVVIDSSIAYNKETGYVSSINPETKLQDIKSKFTTTLKLVAKDTKGNVLEEGSFVGTGTKFEFVDEKNETKYEYTFLIYGDINGDGMISATDYAYVKNHIMEKTLLKDMQAIVSDVNKDSDITSSDYAYIKKYIMGSKDSIKQ